MTHIRAGKVEAFFGTFYGFIEGQEPIISFRPSFKNRSYAA